MDKNTTNPIIWHRYDRCLFCDWDGIELFDYFNSPLGFSKMIDRQTHGEQSFILDKKAIYRARCKRCGRIYNIIWRDGFPLPVYQNDQRIETFINRFVSNSNR